MKVSFRSFLTKEPLRNIRLEMAQGMSQPQINFVISQPMANLISLVPRHNLRARALGWLTTDGLLEASMGREKLLVMVNEQLTKEQSPLKMPAPLPKVTQPSQKVVGMMRKESTLHEVKAGETFGTFGRGPNEPKHGPVRSHDLFSQEAWQRRPDLQNVKLQGMGIHEYYDKYLEPKYMVIDDQGGKYARFYLNDMRDLLTTHGLEPFRYGGFDGYLQFMEKGDFLDDEERRHYLDPNNQQYVDLRPKMSVNKETGQEGIADDVSGSDEKGNPAIHFAGGMASSDEERANDTIEQMRNDFNNIANQLQNGQQTHLYSRHEDEIRKLLLTKKTLEKVELELGASKESRARKIGFPETKHGPSSIPVPNTIDPELLLRAVKLGLDQEVEKPNAEKYPNKEAFGPQWIEGQTKPPDGYYKIVGNKLVYKLPKAAQDAIFAHIYKDFERGILNVRFRLSNFLPTKESDAKIVLSKVFNDGVKAQPQLIKDAKMYVYRLQGVKPESYTKEQQFKSVPIDTLSLKSRDGQRHLGYFPNPEDPAIQHLLGKGYQWELNNPVERQQNQPDWKERRYAVLSLKGSRYRVQFDAKQNTYVMYVPVDKEGKPFRPADFGPLGDTWLAGGAKMTGGLSTGHVAYNPADKDTQRQLIDLIKKGRLGEPGGPYNNEAELPCVLQAVRIARNTFDRKKGFSGATHKLWEDDHDLIDWGIEGLYGFTGDPAFQVGYLKPGEIERFLKKDVELDLAKERDRAEDEKLGGLLGLSGGSTIHTHLSRIGLDEPEDRDTVIQHILDAIENKTPIINFGELGEEIEQAFGQNAFNARVRAIGKYILDRISRLAIVNKDKNTVEFSKFDKPGEGGGRGASLDPTTQDRGQLEKGRASMGQKNIVPPEDLLAHLGQGDQVVGGPQQPSPPNRPTVTPGAEVLSKQPQPMSLDALFNQQAAARQTPAKQAVPKPAPPLTPAQQAAAAKKAEWDKFFNEGKLKDFRSWQLKKESTSVVFDPKVKAGTGCGFNYEGAPGSLSGTNIGGEADTAKTDPTGKGTHGRKARRTK